MSVGARCHIETSAIETTGEPKRGRLRNPPPRPSSHLSRGRTGRGRMHTLTDHGAVHMHTQTDRSHHHSPRPVNRVHIPLPTSPPASICPAVLTEALHPGANRRRCMLPFWGYHLPRPANREQTTAPPPLTIRSHPPQFSTPETHSIPPSPRMIHRSPALSEPSHITSPPSIPPPATTHESFKGI